MKINCIAVDDENLALSKITRFAEKVEYLNLIKCFDNAIDALLFIKQNSVDLIFLDIKMADFTGIQLVESLKNPPLIIFTTAYDQYAIKGFELNVTDYLLKPIEFDRFLKACEKAYAQMQTQLKLKERSEDNSSTSSLTTSEPKSAKKENESIFIKSGRTFVKIFINDILYIEGMKDYLSIYTTNDRVLCLQNFSSMLQMLPEDKFIRLHKSFIVAIDKITKIHNNEVEINKKVIPVGITYRKHFEEVMKKLI